ncbi:MAG: rRNA maturation RNase YbeY [Helicobacter sp.]|nr:rRNA maturation RNase YbeY [Helicobacter sp.]
MLDFSSCVDFEHAFYEKLERIFELICKDFYKDIDIKNIFLELLIINAHDMRELNFNVRGKDEPTDVLSFPCDDMGLGDLANLALGSVVICSDMALSASALYKHTLQDEICLLFIHGLLHCLGFDHELDNGAHREMEAQLVKRFNLPDSLIIRSC